MQRKVKLCHKYLQHGFIGSWAWVTPFIRRVHLSVTKLSHVSRRKMIIARNCCRAVIDVQSLRAKMASSATFATNEGKRNHPGTRSQPVVLECAVFTLPPSRGWSHCVKVRLVFSRRRAAGSSKLIHSLWRPPASAGVMRVKNIISQPEGLCSRFIIYVANPTLHRCRPERC